MATFLKLLPILLSVLPEIVKLVEAGSSRSKHKSTRQKVAAVRSQFRAHYDQLSRDQQLQNDGYLRD